MATTYGMGQLRFNRSSEYRRDLNLPYRSVPVQNSTSESEFFKDMIIENSENFDANSSYLLHLKVPKNPNYQTVFRIKLLSSLASKGTESDYVNPNTSDYQIIKYIEIPQMSGSGTNSRVILYPVNKDDGEIWDGVGEYVCRVAIVIEDIDLAHAGDIVFNNERYYIYDGRSIETSIEIINKNDVIIGHTWALDNVELDTVDFYIVFSPRSSDEFYKIIWIEMFRESYDLDIYYEEDDQGYYGRKINEDYFDAKVYKLTNLVSNTGQSSLSHIGVYGHPNLIMAINGEEIRIGQSGYYELNDFEITNLGIAANNADDTDRFTIDYQYRIES